MLKASAVFLCTCEGVINSMHEKISKSGFTNQPNKGFRVLNTPTLVLRELVIQHVPPTHIVLPQEQESMHGKQRCNPSEIYWWQPLLRATKKGHEPHTTILCGTVPLIKIL